MTTTASSTGSPSVNTRSYAIVTGGYWAFTLTDGALRMLVLLHFNELGYSAVSIAFLFLLYEAMGVATNLLGGWVGARTGLNRTLTAGLALQIVALVALTLLQPSWATWLSVAYVMCAQALSGIAKDLTKMSSKSAVKFVAGTGDGALFRMVAVLTGSKNALKGVGFFVGAALLSWLGFDGALWSLAGLIAIALAAVLLLLDEEIGRSKKKPPLRSIFSKSDAINRLAIARFFLFASRDIWFVVALPVFLADQLDWSHEGVGGFLALWVIGYGMVQSIAPRLLRSASEIDSARHWSLGLAAISTAIALTSMVDSARTLAIVGGLIVYGVAFAANSSLHSYLILAYADGDDVSIDVGFYYSANAAGRLVGTLLSGLLYLQGGIDAALWGSAIFVAATWLLTLRLPTLD